jgi:hypothetical protein
MIIPVITKHFAIGLDLGKAAESTAVAVVERVSVDEPTVGTGPPPDVAELRVRQLRRFPPGTHYLEGGKYISVLLQSAEFRERKESAPFNGTRIVRSNIDLVVDQTAVGSPITEMVLQELGSPNACRVVIAGGHVETYTDGLFHVPKQALVGGLEVLLETRKLKIAEGMPETKLLTEELVNYRGRTTSSNSLTVETWREQPSDDLVFAVALACWQLQKQPFWFEFM